MNNKVGIVIISIAFVISVISPYAVVIFGIPVFLLGLLILWFSEQSRRAKLLWSILPVVFWLPATALFVFAYNSVGMINAQKRDYYINHDFKGTFTVVESACGQNPILKNDRLQFHIPNEGVYLFDGVLKSGVIDERVFQKNEDGTLTQIIDLFEEQYTEESDTIGIERIIGAKFGSFGTMYNSIGGKVNFIARDITTNKVYSDQQQNKLTGARDKRVNKLLEDCDE